MHSAPNIVTITVYGWRDLNDVMLWYPVYFSSVKDCAIAALPRPALSIMGFMGEFLISLTKI